MVNQQFCTQVLVRQLFGYLLKILVHDVSWIPYATEKKDGMLRLIQNKQNEGRKINIRETLGEHEGVGVACMKVKILEMGT